ncbi:2-dehydropantoate 2-reductase [Candidimonas humi]|uniref:2-dehydropantoate 2-reductase n=1 Tax=Candidimonas humi TaxID=683355 RepID=A0ABV8P264_9BURK|nr:2-dehydropantoate 2-reductase [Candidimonas humi]MBV6306549.1 2-dehydropantoate 2-reductase [Candidimonas humi]
MSDKICIVGAGAIGGLIGARLALAGHAQVSALARGATLRALETRGWRLRSAGRLLQAPARASGAAAQLGVQDLVIIAVKATAMAEVAGQIAPLLGPETIVLPAMNGVPWWFCDGTPVASAGPLASVDPQGRIAAVIDVSRVLGCVVHASASTSEPGLVEHAMGQGLIVGEPAGGRSERATRVQALLARAGFDATLSDNVRQEIWYKLWGNLTMNPVSAITGATVDRVLADSLVRDFCSAAMREAAVIGERLGCPIIQSPEDRHVVTAKLGSFKSSMLQDVEAGRPIELDAIVGAVLEIALRLEIYAPNISALFGLARLFAQTRSLYPS